MNKLFKLSQYLRKFSITRTIYSHSRLELFPLFNFSLNLIVTGSNDKIVRAWNPVVTTKPISLLSGHKAGLNDVKIRSDKRLIFSYDKNAVLKVWDIDIGYCLQTLPLRFPRYVCAKLCF